MTKRMAATRLDHPLSPAAYEIVRGLFWSYFRFFHNARVSGKENIPASGPVIVAPNHVSYYDPVLVGLAIPRQVRTMAWNALFRVPGLGWGMRKLGAFEVDPGQADTSAYKQSLLLLRHGQCIVIFPEGRRSASPELEPFETGVARLAIRSGAAIVPATVTGALEAWPRWKKIPGICRPLHVKFHPPVAVPSMELRGEDLHQAIEKLNEAIREPIQRRNRAYWKLQFRRGKRPPLPK